ncbi:MAG: hypothetical protein AB1894_26285 [Chloroflexota bacterium]
MREGNLSSHHLIWSEICRQLNLQITFENGNELKDQLRRKRSITLFFDTVERAPIETVNWLGKTFVSLMEELPDLRAVFAGRSAILARTWGYPLRQKVETRRLTPFKRFSDTQRQMTMAFFYDEDLARLVFDLTSGHPGMVQKIIEWLSQNKIRNTRNLDTNTKAKFVDFVDELVETYILEGVDSDLKPIIRRLAYYRGFTWADVMSLRPNSTLSENDEFTRHRLWPTGLFERRQNSYHLFAVDKTVRELILGVALFRDVNQFIAITEELSNRYYDQATKKTDHWHLLIVESIYQLTNQLKGQQRLGQEINAPLVMSNWLPRRVQRVRDEEKLLRLREALNEDEDLNAMVEQVHPGLYHDLIQIVEKGLLSLEAKKR